MVTKETRPDCVVQFFTRNAMSPEFIALAHLVEIQYDENTHVWFGSLDVACTLDDCKAIADSDEHGHFMAAIRFDDGRQGTTKIVYLDAKQKTGDVDQVRLTFRNDSVLDVSPA